MSSFEQSTGDMAHRKKIRISIGEELEQLEDMEKMASTYEEEGEFLRANLFILALAMRDR